MKATGSSRNKLGTVIALLSIAAFVFAVCGVIGVSWLLLKREQPANNSGFFKDIKVTQQANNGASDVQGDDEFKVNEKDAAKEFKDIDQGKGNENDDAKGIKNFAPAKEKKNATQEPQIPEFGKPAKDGKDAKDPAKEPKFVEPTEILGKKFDAWKRELKSSDPSRREKAMKMILNFGPDKAYDALPDILSDLKRHKSEPVDLSVRIHGVDAMSRILFSKKDPDPKLVDEAILVFRMMLKDRQVHLRTLAVKGVVSLGFRSHELIPEIIEVAHDVNTGEVRKEGVLTLARIAADENKKVHAKIPIELRKALDDKSMSVRLCGLQGLSLIGSLFDKKEKELTVTALNVFLKKEADPYMQMMAHTTVIKITGVVDKTHLGPIVKMLKHKDDVVRGQALQFLKLFGPQAQMAIDDVIALAEEAITWEMRKEAMSTAVVVAFDKNRLHPSILPALQRALQDPSPDVRQLALSGLAAAKPHMETSDAKTSVAKLKAALQVETEPLLRMLGHAAIMTITANVSKLHMVPIVDLLKHKDAAIRLESVRFIAMAGRDAKPFALAAIVEAIRDPDVTIGVAAIDALPSLHAFETMDLLKKIVDDKKADPAILEAAHDALGLLDDVLTLEKTKKSERK